jgi:hypothetical protein
MRKRPVPPSRDPAPPPVPGLDAKSLGLTSTGEMSDGTPPEDWPLFAEAYVSFFAKYPLVQSLLGYLIRDPGGSPQPPTLRLHPPAL